MVVRVFSSPTNAVFSFFPINAPPLSFTPNRSFSFP